VTKRDDGRRRVLSQDERVLWSAITRSIAPLRESGREPAIEAAPRAGKPAHAARHDEAPIPAQPAPPSLVPLGRRMRRRVARGGQAIDARLDLHGLTQAQAHAALLRFLREASAREARLVLVITGKGSRDGERGVLKRQVPQWLALPEFRSFVIGFEGAHIAHGGEGALYVRMRRPRG
jgi:DNA-nicking Smr family endonuclease